MPAYIPGYIQPASRQPFIPDFPKECLPNSPARERGVPYLKAILDTLDSTVVLPTNAPLLCVKQKETFVLRPVKSIANTFLGFDVVFADTGEKDRIYSFNMPLRETAMLAEFIQQHFNPDPARVEYEYLQTINASFIMQHGELDKDDYEKIFEAQRLMATLRLGAQSHRTPFPGDTIQGTYYNGKHPFQKGVIIPKPRWADEQDTKIHFCAEPYVPYITKEGHIDTSGGPFFSAEKKHLTFVGEEERLFWCFGHNGACANGGIHFPCRSNRWELSPHAGI